MTEDGLGSLVTILILLSFHAIISVAYAALTNSRTHLLRDQTEGGTNIPPRLHITYKITRLLVRLTIAAVAITGLGGWLMESLSIGDPMVERTIAYIAVLLPTALLILILGDLVPEAVGSANADRIAPWAVYPMRFLNLLFSPVTTVMLALSKSLASAFGSANMVNVFTEEEIMTMLDASEKEGTIESDEKEMLYSILEFGDTVVSEVMIPRIDIVAVDIHTPLDEALKAFIDSGHSRIPVYEESIDNIKGLLYAKDLLNYWGKQNGEVKPIREIMRKASFVPESKRADELMQDLRSSKIHMVIVVDEYGGTAGLVTFEDLIEEIVGDIQDEYDLNEEADYVKVGPDTYLVDASMNLDDFNDVLDVEVPTDDSNTLGGYLFARFGRVPEVGEQIEFENLTLGIDTIEGRRIRKVRVTRKSQSLADSPTSLNNNLTPQPIPK